MSTSEYHDLYLKCQDTGKYHMFVFDIVGSKKMSSTYRNIAQIKMMSLMNSLYSEIERIEREKQKKILVFEEDFVSFKSGKRHKGFGLKQEPFLLGDTFGFTIYRDTLDRETIYLLYETLKSKLDIDFDFHISDGYYETNDYSEGNTKYFRGYCLDLLSNFHKERTISELNKVKKQVNHE